MNKKEIAEIKKLYEITDCSITQVAGCYVDGEDNIKTIFRNNFLSLPEEVIFKYLEIFKKSLSGKVDKNLITLEFPKEAEQSGGTQYSLLELRNSALKNNDMLTAFYDRIIESYQHSGNYLILLIHNNYDIPGRASDNRRMEDSSEEVYSYITCVICPVELSKAGLSYDQTFEAFKNRERDWVVKMPEVGFTFPTFNDRSTDIHSVLYYEKSGKLQNDEIMTDILGCSRIRSADEQQAAFNSLLKEMNCDMEEVVNVHEKLNEMLNENDEKVHEPMDKKAVEKLLQGCLKEPTLQNFDQIYDKEVGIRAEIVPTNITNTKSIEIKNSSISVKVNTDKMELVTEKIIDGKKYLLIPIDENVEVNGALVKNNNVS